MRILADLHRALSGIQPLWFLLIYLAAIPMFGVLYVIAAPQGFRAIHAGDEASGASRAEPIEAMLEQALRRSLKQNSEEKFALGGQELDPASLADSLLVDSARIVDGTTMSIRVRLSAIGVYDFEGERQFGWSFIVNVPEFPSSAILLPNSATFYRFPVTDFSVYPSPLKEQFEKLFELIFGQENYGFGMRAPALTLGYLEDLQLRRYFENVREGQGAINRSIWAAMCLSAKVMTTLGPGDTVPTTKVAVAIVASEAIVGIILVALFLNSVAYRASVRRE